MEFTELRKQVIKKYFGRMNDKQFEAVTTVKGPLLVLAGAAVAVWFYFDCKKEAATEAPCVEQVVTDEAATEVAE